MTLGTRIEQLRHEQAIGVCELARRADMGSGHLSNVEQDNRCRHVSVWTVRRIARGLGVPLDVLMESVDAPDGVKA